MKAKRKTSPKHGRNSELDDATGGKFVRKRVSSLKPSPENEALYQLPDDTEIIKLAEVLRSRRCDPLTITLDSFIVSGHRRRLALVLNGQQWVDCRILPFRREDLSRDEYVKLLRDQNHQRHKTAAEQAREELVDIDPEEAYRNLRELRDKSLRRPEHNSVAMLEIEGSKRRFDISEDKAEHVKYI